MRSMDHNADGCYRVIVHNLKTEAHQKANGRTYTPPSYGPYFKRGVANSCATRESTDYQGNVLPHIKITLEFSPFVWENRDHERTKPKRQKP